MALFEPGQQAFAQSIAHLNYCNPFLPDRIRHEQEALGSDFLPLKSVWSLRADLPVNDPNVKELIGRAHALADVLLARLDQGVRPDSEEQAVLYEDLIFFVLYHRYYPQLFDAVKTVNAGGKASFAFYRRFEDEYRRYFHSFPGRQPTYDPARLFAGYFQIARAFHSIFFFILGESVPMVRLRAAIWQSIFTHDMRRYWRALFGRMGEMTCLITGPSGSGKELVARAIAFSRHIPFNVSGLRFEEDFNASLHALNLAALSPTLIESELFGHRKGAFTGAVQDRLGWLEICSPLGTVFLDEVAEIDGAIQVKLLRVLQSRTFQRLGDTADKRFVGKIVAATNRNLAEDTRQGRFREDLYYRLCSDRIETPSLFDQISQPIEGEKNETLTSLVAHTARRLLGAGEEPVGLIEEALDWIQRRLGPEYPWPGNVRELEQCVCSILIRKDYTPLGQVGKAPADALARAMGEARLTADEVLNLYCAMVYEKTGSYQACARRLGLDHRTVKTRMDPDLLRRFLAESGERDG